MSADITGFGDRSDGLLSGGDATVELVELDADECLALMESEPVGRLGIGRPQSTPLVIPVNFVVSGRSILFRTGFGTKLPSLLTRPVSFQVDRLDHVERTGWSVLAAGRAEEISARSGGEHVPEPWVSDHKPYLIRISIKTISGRRIVRRAASNQH